jgi:hypothetical protein
MRGLGRRMRPEIISRIISHSLFYSKAASQIFYHSSQFRIASCCSFFGFNFIKRINEKEICVHKLRRSFKINYEQRREKGGAAKKADPNE